jgi:hypothetical protein
VELFVRYQSPVPDRRGRRVGVFGLVNMLGNRGYLSAESAAFLMGPIPGYLAILASHNLPCERCESGAPGRVLYEDEHQVVVVADEDLDFTSMMWLRPKLS